MQIAADASRSCQPFAAFAIKFPRVRSSGPRGPEREKERGRGGGGEREEASETTDMHARISPTPRCATRLHGLSASQRDKACKSGLRNYIGPASREPSKLRSLRSLLRSRGFCSRRKTRANLPRKLGVGVPRRDVTLSQPIDLMRF